MECVWVLFVSLPPVVSGGQIRKIFVCSSRVP